MSEQEKRCDQGGMYWCPQIPGPDVYQEKCGRAATHRYRSPGMADGHWGGRCDEHAAWLDRSVCTVEPMALP